MAQDSGQRTARRSLLRRLAGVLPLLLGTGLTSRRPALAADPGARPHRPRVPDPMIALSPGEITVDPGARVILTALPSGGEAILFSVDWSVSEGDQGGALAPDDGRHDDGSFTATYTAPDQGGPFHVVASLHEFPAVQAVATISLRPG
jgi:hypothetical protein